MSPQRAVYDAPHQAAIIPQLASSIARRGWAAPAIMFLETIKPLSFAGSQLLLMLDPLLNPLWGETGRRYGWLLEDRRRIDELLRALSQTHEHR